MQDEGDGSRMTSEEQSDGKDPTITFTDSAREKLLEVLGEHGSEAAGLRLQILGRSKGEFQHVLSLVPAGMAPEDDTLLEVDGINVYLEPSSRPYLDGIEIGFTEKGPSESGLEYVNPNPLWRDKREFQIQDIFDNHINPAIASHGGWVNLLGVEGDTAYVRLGGGCQGCGMADVTLKQGIEATILQMVEGIERVIDQTDHASGDNPYY
ncbi:MAG: NifU family protein, partial [Dehalococcoidia bacterium]